MTKKEYEKALKESQFRENRTFLRYMLVANATTNHFKLKKDMTIQEMASLSYKCEKATYEELKKLWQEYMGFPWRA